MSKKKNKKRKSLPVLFKAYAVILEDGNYNVLMGSEKQIEALKRPYSTGGYVYMQLIGCNTDYNRLENFVSDWTNDTNNPISNRRLAILV